MDASHVIAAFGGPTKVARRFGSRPNAVSNWRRDGIPAKFWMDIVEAARQDGLNEITPELVRWRPTRDPVAA